MILQAAVRNSGIVTHRNYKSRTDGHGLERVSNMLERVMMEIIAFL